MLQLAVQPLIRRYRPKRPPTKRVAVLIPLSTKPTFTPDEQISLRHVNHYLGRYDRYLLAPEGSTVAVPTMRTLTFPRKFFGSAAAHNHLTYFADFYRAFADYEFILFYHLDSLVFSDQLEFWCDAGLDYIGPPWIPCSQTPWVREARVGNGGFTLLRVRAALEVLSNRFRQRPATYWLDMFARNSERVEPVVRWLKTLQRRFPRSKLINRPIEEWEKMRSPGRNRRNNDVFWSYEAQRYLPSFKIASVEQGLRFAFEASPSTCFAMNGGQIPFGCHAWTRFDRAFWEPLLLPPNDRIDVQKTVAPATAS